MILIKNIFKERSIPPGLYWWSIYLRKEVYPLDDTDEVYILRKEVYVLEDTDEVYIYGKKYTPWMILIKYIFTERSIPPGWYGWSIYLRKEVYPLDDTDEVYI